MYLHKIFRRNKNQLRIVVLPQLTRVGDLVCATPVFRAIKEKYPDAYLSVITTSKVEGIIKNNPRIDEIIIYRSSRLFGLVKAIRKGKFDWGFSLSGTSFGNLIFFSGFVLNRAKITRSGRPISEKVTDWMAPYKIFYKHGTYLAGKYLKMLEYIGIKNAEDKKEIFFTDVSDRRAVKFFYELGVKEKDLKIGISVTAGNKIKEWGDGKFAELAQKIIEKYKNAAIFFLGSARDGKRVDSILSRLSGGGFFKAVDFNLEELPSLMKRLNLYIAVDTGPIYIAHALGVPLVDITGPVDPWEQPPHDERSFTVTPTAPFNPSSFVLKAPGPKYAHKAAIERTTVDMVMAAVDSALGKIEGQK